MLNRPELILIAHNIRSLHNVGSIFRTCDGAGVSKLYLTGYTGFPPRKEIKKTALGADETVPWEQSWEIEPVLDKLSESGFDILAVEQNTQSISYTDYPLSHKLALIVGNEVEGLEPEVLERSDICLHVPMYGQKNSLNVAVCTGIMLYGVQDAYRAQREVVSSLVQRRQS